MSVQPAGFCRYCRMLDDWDGPMNDVRDAERLRREADHPHHGAQPAELALRVVPHDVVQDEPGWLRDAPPIGASGVHERRHEPDAPQPAAFPEPEDMGSVRPTEMSDVEYVADVVRPGRVTLIGAEEGAGKTIAVAGELAVRLAVAGGKFAGTWDVPGGGNVLYLSQMALDDDIDYIEMVCAELGVERAQLTGKYWRWPIFTAAGGSPILKSQPWLEACASFCRDHVVRLLVIDTGDDATEDVPWGKAMSDAYRALAWLVAAVPGLSIVVLVHMKKPAGGGLRRISDIRGEWGRLPDIVLLMEKDGQLRTRLSLLKRTTNRVVIVTKRGGLLVDPEEPQPQGRKVSPEKFLAAVAAHPGVEPKALATALGVTERTVRQYVKDAGEAVRTEETKVRGAAKTVRYFPATTETTEDGGNEGPSAVVSAATVPDGDIDGGKRKRLYIEGVSVSSVVEPPSPEDEGSSSMHLDPGEMWLDIDDRGGLKGTT